jgi:hypothetical protein
MLHHISTSGLSHLRETTLPSVLMAALRKADGPLWVGQKLSLLVVMPAPFECLLAGGHQPIVRLVELDTDDQRGSFDENFD